MTRFARGLGMIHLMAIQTAVHRHDAGDLGHRRDLRHISVARLTFYASRKMSAMGPRYSGDHFVNAHPGNLLVRCGVLRDLLYGGLVLRNGDVALHTFGSLGKSHELAGLGIGVTLLAFQTEGKVLLMAIRNTLLRRRMRARIVGHHMFRGRVRAGARGLVRWRLPGGRLLRGATGRNAEQCDYC